MKFMARRTRNFGLLAVAIGLAYIGLSIVDLSLNIQSFYSGWLLVSIIVVLMSFYLKKRLSVVPLGRNSVWAQWHYYLGLLLFAIFLKHLNFKFPDGNVELALTLFFLIVTGSGIVGGIINRVFARRLSFLDEEIIYERIPLYRQQLKAQVEKMLSEVVAKTGSTTLSDYYLNHLIFFFTKQQHFMSHILGGDYNHLRIQNKLEQQIRYLNSDEADCAFKLRALIEQKDILDRHSALQGVLKYWGVLHLPMALVLICLLFVHIVLVYAFRGAA